MATSTPLFSLSPLVHRQTASKLLLSSPIYGNGTKSIRILCSCSSYPQSTTSLETLPHLPPNHSVNHTTLERWVPHRKRKVLMRVGHAGIDFRAMKKELEIAIYKAGGIHESNFGDPLKNSWATSSLIHDEVHSLSTMISLKMEIPEYAWIDDPNGVALAAIVNTYLPKNIRVFSILPAQKGFDVKKECNMRKYCYLLPQEIIGIISNFSEAEIDHHISEFNDILQNFQEKRPFHNYTTNPKHKKKNSAKQSADRGHIADTRAKLSSEPHESRFDESSGESESGYDGEEALMTDEKHMSLRNTDSDVQPVDESDANGNGLNDLPILAKWIFKPDEKDRVFEYHFRTIFHCSCGTPKHLFGASYVEISICGDSFMLDQVLKMVGAAVAVKRGLLLRDVIPLSLCKFARFTLPIAPPELLFLQWNHYFVKSKPGKAARPEIRTMVESEEIQSDVEDFYKSIMLPQLLEFLDPLKSPWQEWVALLDANTRIPDTQLDEVRNAWIAWKDNSPHKDAS